MPNTTLTATLAALAVTVSAAGAAPDWKGDIARKAVGRAVREGLEDAIKDAALDATLDAVLPNTVTYVPPDVATLEQLTDIGESVRDGVDSAMRVADVASKLDDAADAARAVKKVHKAVKVLKR